MTPKPTILVVDDDPRYQRLVEINLVSADYDIIKAANGQEAVEMTANHKPDLLLMDVMMPIMNGLPPLRGSGNLHCSDYHPHSKGEERDVSPGSMRC